MSKSTNIWLITACSLVVVGCVIFGCVMASLSWDFSKLSTDRYETNRHRIEEEYHNLSIVSDTADVELVLSENGIGAVVCYERENVTHSVAVQDGTLVIQVEDTRQWYEYIGINFGSPKITVTIPKSECGILSVQTDTGDVKIPENIRFESIDVSVSTGHVTCLASAAGEIGIETDTGDIHVEDVQADSLRLSVSTGRVVARSVTCIGDMAVRVSTGDTTLTDVACKSFASTGNTGDLSLESVIAADVFSIERSTGDVRFERCDAAEMLIETDTGHVKGSLLTDKVFVAETDTGRVDVPKTTTGGRCEIHTDTGDIRITIQQDG